jgi:HD-GYP domain-containing protein (c-di-GMP phosphodiesterase class II)
MDHLASIPRSKEVIIKAVHDRYFVNDLLVRLDEHTQVGAETVVKEWRRLGVGGVVFDHRISPDQVASFLQFMATEKPSVNNLEALSAQLAELKIPYVKLLSMREAGADVPTLSEEARRQFRQMARRTFVRAITTVQDIVLNTAHDKDINTSKTKRVVHSLIDHIAQDESSLLELAAIKDYDDYTYAHSTNVCVYSLTMGVRLGFDRPRLSQLGFAALFHDIGKVKLPADLIRKPDAFDENDWIQMQKHPQLGAKTILHNLKFDTHTARAARGAFEHHINQDFTGYPVLRHQRRRTGLFARIISIVDTFDALTSGRVYIKKQIPPDEVIRKMRYQMQSKFDPFLLKIFNDVIGIYPAGSLVLLTTEEIALVLTNNEKDLARPYVKIIGNRAGLLAEPLWVDLSAADNLERKIVRFVDPASHGLDIKDFVLTD